MKKELVTLSQEIIGRREWDFLEREYPDKDERNRKKDVMAELVRGEIDPKTDMVHLYEEGVTCQELGDLLGRSFQSVSRSVKTHGDADTVGKHREKRKEWVWLMKRYWIVYLTDMSGKYERLMAEYGVTLSKAKDMYRRAGGTVLIKKARSEDDTVDKRIEDLLGSGYTGVEIAKILEMPLTTVYYRINTRIKQEQDSE